jgi:hypothetical protein
MLMRRRLYFVLSDIESARKMLDEMLLARIEEKRIHFLLPVAEPCPRTCPRRP